MTGSTYPTWRQTRMHATNNASFVILMADDDSDDRMLTSEALAESRESHTLEFVEDGFELLEYLRCEGNYAKNPRSVPSLILLDLNMPRMNGLEALAILKADPNLRLIPVVVLTTSNSETDILSSYSLGAASFLTKPSSFVEMVNMMSALSHYWISYVQLPPAANSC